MKYFSLLLLVLIVLLTSSCSIAPSEEIIDPFEEVVAKLLDKHTIHKSDLNLEGDVKSYMHLLDWSGYEDNLRNASKKPEDENSCFKYISLPNKYELDKYIDFEYFDINKNGDVTKMVIGPCGSGEVTIMEYDGNMLLSKTRSDFNGSVFSDVSFDYDSRGRLVGFDIESERDTRNIRMTYSDHFITYHIAEENNGKYPDTLVFLQDKRGNYIDSSPGVENYFNADSILVKSISSSKDYFVIDYDLKGNKVRKANYDSLDYLVKSESYTYTSDSKLYSLTVLDSTGYSFRIQNDKGSLVEYTRISSFRGQLNVRTTINYYDLDNKRIQRTEIRKGRNSRLEETQDYFEDKYVKEQAGGADMLPDSTKSRSNQIIEYY